MAKSIGLTLEEIQYESFKILLKIDDICKELGLTYFLAYGTLLGAIRHKGFIPWDDDIDIMMYRNDYETLIQYFDEHKERLYPYTYRNRKNCVNCLFGITRITDITYQYSENNRNAKPIDLGTFVDVYILDNYGNSENDAKFINKKIRKWNYIWSAYCNGQSSSLKKTLVKYPLHIFLKVLFFDEFRFAGIVETAIENIVSKYTSDMDFYIGSVTWDAYGGTPYDKKLFAEVSFCEFEGYKLMIPKHYHEILKQGYGDYMELPPLDMRNPHHDYTICKR